MAKHPGLNISAVTDVRGEIDESKSTLESANELLVFSSIKPFPGNALKGINTIKQSLERL